MSKPQERATDSSVDKIPMSQTTVIRDLYEFYTGFEAAVHRRHRLYGKIWSWRPVLKRSYMLLGAEANQFVLVQNPKLFSAKKAWEEFIGVLFRGGLLNRDGPDHRKFRRLLTPAFRQEALDSYLESAEPIMNQSIASWPRECPDIYGRVKELTLQIALRVFFGITLEKEALQKNLWARSGIGSSPTV
jgi:cytochrome P450